MLLSNLQWQSLLFFLIIVVGLSSFFQDKYSFLYGVFIGLVNLAMSIYYLYRSKQSVTKEQGQALIEVMKSMILRLIVVCNMLVFGFVWLDADPVAIFFGFVLGQIFYLFNQLIGIVKHG